MRENFFIQVPLFELNLGFFQGYRTSSDRSQNSLTDARQNSTSFIGKKRLTTMHNSSIIYER